MRIISKIPPHKGTWWLGAQWGPRNVCKDFLAVEAKRINEAVRNNPDKFPADYMFALTADESAILRSEFSSLEHGGTGKFPADYMFMLTADELSDLRSRFLTANARAANPPRVYHLIYVNAVVRVGGRRISTPPPRSALAAKDRDAKCIRARHVVRHYWQAARSFVGAT